MAEALSIISLISFIVSAVCLVLAIFFWFKFGIPAVIGDLTGRTARKSIAKMRENNERTGNKSYRSSSTNTKRGKLTSSIDIMPETALLAEKRTDSLDLQQTELLDGAEETSLLIDEEETAALDTTVQQPVKRSGGKKLVMIEEVMIIHTDEVIE